MRVLLALLLSVAALVRPSSSLTLAATLREGERGGNGNGNTNGKPVHGNNNSENSRDGDGEEGSDKAAKTGIGSIAASNFQRSSEHRTTSGSVVRQQLQSGVIEGDVTSLNVRRFLGVPFAAPPVGQLRWEPPREVSKWTGVRPAHKYSKSCAQHENTFDDFSGISEDCLYLNLWLPDALPQQQEQKYAAMIFFYGGSWTTGSAMFPLYTGEALTVANNATVVVTVNYRLAAFGFLGSDFLRASDNSTGNFGLQDQRLAIKWLHDNADFLNVDPSKIMIFGESAGAGSVSSHLVSHRSRGLFTRAAMESGPFADWTSDSLEDSHLRFVDFATQLNCTMPDAGASPEQIAALQACLRSRNMTQIVDVMHHLPGKGLVDWSPTVDGVEFTDEVQILASKGDIANVPVLLGTNKNEGTTFCSLDLDANKTATINWIRYNFGSATEAQVDALIAAYPPSDFKAHSFATAGWWAASEMVGDSQMTCAARRTARYLNTLRGPNAASAFVYYYEKEVALIPLIELASKKPYGVFHGSELAMVFSAEELLLTKEERELSKTVREYWTNFAATGDPNKPRDATKQDPLPQWPAHLPSTNLTLSINDHMSNIVNIKGSRCDLWDAIGPVDPP